MNCPKCNAENLVGTFCTVCGAQLSDAVNPTMGSNLAESNPLNSETIPPTKNKSKQLVLGAVVIASLLAGLGFYFFTKESPAAPQLRALCDKVESVDFGKLNKDDTDALLSEIQPLINSARVADPEVSKPFVPIVTAVELQSTNMDTVNTKMAIAIALDLTYSLIEVQTLLDQVIADGEKLEVDIDIACVDFQS